MKPVGAEARVLSFRGVVALVWGKPKPLCLHEES
jgi:hypothetical protein